jgi:hypothetical protein
MDNKKTGPKPKPFKQVRDPKELQEDLAHYAQEAIRVGATDAKPIRASDVVIDERVRAKCMIPKCFGLKWQRIRKQRVFAHLMHKREERGKQYG